MANTYSMLNYHFVFSTKGRKRLPSILLPDLHSFLAGCLRTLGAVPIRVGGVEDHVHAVARLKPTHRIADVLRDVKKASSEWLHASQPRFHWQDGYSVFTVSPSRLDHVSSYIEHQADHHRKATFEDELRSLLTAHRVEFDERYLL
jgi:putative transposase